MGKEEDLEFPVMNGGFPSWLECHIHEHDFGLTAQEYPGDDRIDFMYLYGEMRGGNGSFATGAEYRDSNGQ